MLKQFILPFFESIVPAQTVFMDMFFHSESKVMVLLLWLYNSCDSPVLKGKANGGNSGHLLVNQNSGLLQCVVSCIWDLESSCTPLFISSAVS